MSRIAVRHRRGRRIRPRWGRIFMVTAFAAWVVALVAGIGRAVVTGDVHSSVWPPLGLGLLVLLMVWLVRALRATIMELEDETDSISDAALLAEIFEDRPQTRHEERSGRWSA